MSEGKAAVPLTVESFGGKCWTAPADHGFLAELGAVPLAAQEIGELATEFPLYFGEHQGTWYVFTDLGKGAGPLAFDAQGRLLSKALPFLVKTYPFTTLNLAGSWALGIFDGTGCVSDTGRPLYEGQAPSRTVAALSKRMAQFLDGMQQAGRLVKTLADVDVLRCDQSADVSGLTLWQVDEKKLAELDLGQLEKVHRNGALGLGYTQVLSQIHARRPAGTARAAIAPEGSQPPDAFLNSILDDIDDGDSSHMGSFIQ